MIKPCIFTCCNRQERRKYNLGARQTPWLYGCRQEIQPMKFLPCDKLFRDLAEKGAHCESPGTLPGRSCLFASLLPLEETTSMPPRATKIATQNAVKLVSVTVNKDGSSTLPPKNGWNFSPTKKPRVPTMHTRPCFSSASR